MRNLISTLTLALHAAAVAANATLDPRQGTASLSGVTCGTASYTKQEVDAAVAEGCRLYAAGEQLGTSKYPHKFNNREGLTLATSGPYQEFPILASGAVYSGKAPGADRVVINANYQGSCVFVGAMTHTNAASRNGFVACKESSGSAGSATSSVASRSSSATSSRTASATSTSSSPTSTPTSTANPNGNAAARGVVAGMGGQGVVAGLVAGLILM